MRKYTNINKIDEVNDLININVELRNQFLEQLHIDISQLLESEKELCFLTEDELTEIEHFDYRVQVLKNKKEKNNPLPQKSEEEMLVEIFNNSDDGVIDLHLKHHRNNQPEL